MATVSVNKGVSLIMIAATNQSKNQLKVLGQAISARAKELKLDQRSLATRTGLALNSVRSVLAGKRGNMITYLSICEQLQWTIIDLVNEISKNPVWKAECQIQPQAQPESKPSQASSSEKPSLAKTPS